MLSKVGCRRDTKVRLGAWSWDTTTGEEFRVGAGLAEPFYITWCAVEYFEASGSILRMLLHHLSPNVPHFGRTIVHHAILCGNARAFEVLLSCGADIEFPIQTSKHIDVRPVHLASRLGLATILGLLIGAGCNLNSRTGSGDTALMICARYKQEECLKLLASSGSDIGLFNTSGESAMSIAASVQWTHGFERAVLDVIRAGKVVTSSNSEIFSSLVFVTRANDVEALTGLIKQPNLNIDEKDENGFSAVMVAAAGGHIEAFRRLVAAGADVALQNKYGETAISIAKANQNHDAFAKILAAHANTKKTTIPSGSYPLHHAVRLNNIDSVRELGNKGHGINVLDSEGYTPLMLAAKLGDGNICELLISYGADCDIKNARHETALSLARKGKGAESVILDELARRLVVSGALVKKHTKGGKGSPHVKMLKMVEAAGVLHWGKSSKRNVICRGAEVGPSCAFRWNRRRKRDADDAGVFRVVTTKNKEIHFSCSGGLEKAKLWVRGIRLLTREAIFGRNNVQ